MESVNVATGSYLLFKLRQPAAEPSSGGGNQLDILRLDELIWPARWMTDIVIIVCFFSVKNNNLFAFGGSITYLESHTQISLTDR